MFKIFLSGIVLLISKMLEKSVMWLVVDRYPYREVFLIIFHIEVHIVYYDTCALF